MNTIKMMRYFNELEKDNEIMNNIQQKVDSALKHKKDMLNASVNDEKGLKLLEEIDININYRKSMLQMWKIKKLYNEKLIACCGDDFKAEKSRIIKVIPFLEKLVDKHKEYAYEAMENHHNLVSNYDYSEKSHIDLCNMLKKTNYAFEKAYKLIIADYK